MINKFLSKNFYINTIIVILIFILDRFSKIYVMYLDKINYSPELYKSKFLNINLIWNDPLAMNYPPYPGYTGSLGMAAPLIVVSVFLSVLFIKFNTR